MKPLKLLAAYFLGEGLAYLSGAFACASFDVSTWAMPERIFIAFLGMIAGLLLSGIVYGEQP